MTVTAAPVGSAQAHASAYSGRRRQAALLVVALAFSMDLMDATILTIALPPSGGALGIAVVGEVFFSQLTGSGGYGHAFALAAVLQVALLAASAVVALFLPREEEFKPQVPACD